MVRICLCEGPPHRITIPSCDSEPLYRLYCFDLSPRGLTPSTPSPHGIQSSVSTTLDCSRNDIARRGVLTSS
ncbi:hypothetical protein IAR50_005755 [Cryptococcus sp. DSM 104548]